MKMKVSVVIPNWQGRALLEKNLPFVFGIGADEVIVVDDASTDDSVKFIKNLKRKNPSLKLIENKKNMGFARTVNRGVAKAKGDVVVLLNTDVKPLPGLLAAVLPHFKDRKVFGVSFAEKRWSWAKGIWQDGFVEHKPGPKRKAATSTLWVSGGSGAFRKSTWEKIGGFDTIFSPFYWEDLDLSYRALKRGFELIWEPKARVLHQHEAIISKNFPKNYIDLVGQRNQLFFIWKNITSPAMTKQHIKSLIARAIQSPGYLRVLLAALAKLPGVLQKRAKEAKAAKVSDETIFAGFKS